MPDFYLFQDEMLSIEDREQREFLQSQAAQDILYHLDSDQE